MNMKQTNIRMPSELLNQFKQLAEKENVKVSKLIRQSMELYISKERQHGIKHEDKLLSKVVNQISNQIGRKDTDSLCMINDLCSDLFNAYLVKIGYSVQPTDILHAAQQLLNCGLSLDQLHSDKINIINEYVDYHISKFS